MHVNNWIRIFACSCLILFTIYSISNAQTINIEQKVEVRKGSVPIAILLKELSAQTGIRFSFNTSEFNVFVVVVIYKSPQTIREILEHIVKNRKLIYRVLGQHVIFQQSSQKSSQIKISPKPRTRISQDSTKLITRPARSIKIPALIPVADRILNIAPGVEMKARPLPRSTISQIGNSNGGFRKNIPMLIKAGIRADDILYTGFEVHGGLQIIFGILNWSTNYQASGVRYGVGSLFDLSGDWRLGVSATTGKFSKNFLVDTFITRKIKVNSVLYSLNMTFEKRLGDQAVLQFGPTYNFLKTSYYYNGTRQALSGIPGIGQNIDRSYRIIKPAYLITNTFRPGNSSNKKSWIGLHLLLLYQFR